MFSNRLRCACLVLGVFLLVVLYIQDRDSLLLSKIIPLWSQTDTIHSEGGSAHLGKASSDFIRFPDQNLQDLYLRRLRNLSVFPEKLFPYKCSNTSEEQLCLRQPCNATFPPPEERLRHILRSQYPISAQHKAVIDNLTDQSGPADLVFITAASSNHYLQVIGVLHGLQTLVFPKLRNDSVFSYKLLCYDLGLTAKEVQKLREKGQCTSIIRVPFERLPGFFKDLRACTWKPLLIQSNVHQSKVTIWMDASTRFQTGDLSSVVQHALQHGLHMGTAPFMMPAHIVRPTLSYFGLQPCLLSRFKEMAGGFVAVKNDLVMRRAVLGPWVSCAFSPSCMCPGDDCVSRYWPLDKSKPSPTAYSRRHRFDQATLGLILGFLFDWRVTSFCNGHAGVYAFHRTDFKRFPEMLL